MTLEPDARLLLSEALQPPPGYDLAICVATTYSLDLITAFIAPLTFASSGENLEETPAIERLAAAQRYSKRIAFFCQPGRIAVPSVSYRPELVFLEDSIIEVKPKKGVFHPKVWALRFKSEGLEPLHRVLVASRNITSDRSWDTLLCLEQACDEEEGIDSAPLVSFLEELPGIATKRSTRGEELVSKLCSSLRDVAFAVPEPFTSGEFLPLGFDWTRPGYPFPQDAEAALAISPFMSKRAVAKLLSRTTGKVTVVSRTESFDKLGEHVFGTCRPYVLRPSARLEPHASETQDKEAGSAEAPETPSKETVNAELTRSLRYDLEGLHAKTYVFDLPRREAQVITGSANLTFNGWNNNVEFGVKLTGPKAKCGTKAVLGDSNGSNGLMEILTAHNFAEAPENPDPSDKIGREIDREHAKLAAVPPMLHVSPNEDGSVCVKLEVQWDSPGATSMRLWSTKEAKLWDSAQGHLTWSNLSRAKITPFVVVETTVEGVARACLVKAELQGDLGDRTADVLNQLVTTPEHLLQLILAYAGSKAASRGIRRRISGGLHAGAPPSQSESGALIDFPAFEALMRVARAGEGDFEHLRGLITSVCQPKQTSPEHDPTSNQLADIYTELAPLLGIISEALKESQ